MTYFTRIFINSDDGPSIDAFGRYRVSQPVNIFDDKQLHNSGALNWSTSSSFGGVSTFDVNRASTALSVPSTDGATCIRQSRQRMRYQPGKSMLAMLTCIIGTGSANIIKRAGLFDASNGIFLEQSGTNTNFVIRSNVSGSPIENRVSQSQWNLDTLDGTGNSTETLDLSKAQILVEDVEWLGVGRVRVGFVFDGKIVYAHKFNHANIIDSVYMSTPNLPVRFEISNDGTSTGGSIEHVCSTVASEGGLEQRGISLAVDRGKSPITVPSGSLCPIISTRVSPNDGGAAITPSDIQLLCTTNASFRWALYLNPTIAGTDNADWQTIENTSLQFDISRTNTNTLTGGTMLASGYAPSVAAGGASTESAINVAIGEAPFLLGCDIDNNPDELVLAVETLESGNEVFYGSIQMRELS